MKETGPRASPRVGAMAMEPVHLVCEGCGVRLRTSTPAKARGRDCPRCSWPLAAAVDRLLSRSRDPVCRPAAESARPRARRWTTGTVAVLVTIGSLASLIVREASPGPSAPPVGFEIVSAVAEAPPVSRTDEADDSDREPTNRPAAAASPALALPKAEGHDPAKVVTPSGKIVPDGKPRPPEPVRIAPEPPPPPLAPQPAEPRRVLVRDQKGRAIVAREHGMIDKRMAVLLPDGQIGWPDGLVITDRPFVPLGMDEMRRSLLDDTELTPFTVHQTAHYLIFYQSSEKFALASADLLEKLHDGLTGLLKKAWPAGRAAGVPPGGRDLSDRGRFSITSPGRARCSGVLRDPLESDLLLREIRARPGRARKSRPSVSRRRWPTRGRISYCTTWAFNPACPTGRSGWSRGWRNIARPPR